MINIEINAPDIQEIKAKLGQLSNRSHVVLARAVNRTVTHTKVNIAKQAKLKYIITQKTVKNTLDSNRATRRNPHAIITSKGSTIPLIDFNVSPRRHVKRLKRGKFSPNIYKSRTIRDSELKGVERMFVAKNQVLIRPENAKSDTKIKNWLRFGASVPQMINNKDVYRNIHNQSVAKLKERVNHEIEYELRRLES